MMESYSDVVIQDHPDFYHYYVPPPSLVALSAKTCVLHSELLLGQLHATPLPMEIQRVLVKTFQSMDTLQHERRQRFYDALKDIAGAYRWRFPGCPLVFPGSSPDVVHLDYLNSPFDAEALPEHSSRIERLSVKSPNCAVNILSVFKLTWLMLYRAIYPILDPSPTLLHLELSSCSLRDLQFLAGFPNLEWLSVACSTFVQQADLFPLFALRKLRHLDLTGISQRWMMHYDFALVIRWMPQLEGLDLSQNEISDRTIRALHQYRNAKPLEFLGLRDTLGYWEYNRLPPLPAKTVARTLRGTPNAAVLQFCPALHTSSQIFSFNCDWEMQVNYILQVMRMWIDTHQLGNKSAIITKLYKLVIKYAKEIPRRVKQVLVDALLDFAFARGRDFRHHRECYNIFTMFHRLLPDACDPTRVGRFACLRLYYTWATFDSFQFIYSNYGSEAAKIYRKCLARSKESATIVFKLLNSQLRTVLHLTSVTSNRNKKIRMTAGTVRMVCGVFGYLNYTAVDECTALVRQIEATRLPELSNYAWRFKPSAKEQQPCSYFDTQNCDRESDSPIDADTDSYAPTVSSFADYDVDSHGLTDSESYDMENEDTPFNYENAENDEWY